MMPFQAVAELRIGHVVEISGLLARVELSGDVLELSRSYDGRVYPIGQIGSVVKVHFGRRIVFGLVAMLRMRSDELAQAGIPVPPDADQRVMEIELFAEGVWSSGDAKLDFSRGVTTYPLPRQGVYLLTRSEAQILYSSAEAMRPGGADPMVPFSTYIGVDVVPCRANIDRMFGMHCAILGSTGSGKSGAVAALLHRVLDHRPYPNSKCRPRIIIIDPHGEYGSAFTDRAVVFRAYDPIGTEESAGTPIKLPYWLMSADEFRMLVIGKTEREATSQHNIVYKALTHARMVTAKLVDHAPADYSGPVPQDGGSPDTPRPARGVDAARLLEFDRDKPLPFSLDEFWNHINFLQATRPSKSGGQLERVPAGEFSENYRSILDKFSLLRRDPRIHFLMENWSDSSPSLAEIINQFVGAASTSDTDERELRIIDISGLPNEVAGPLASMLARLLFQYKLYQDRNEREKDPILLVCEEAHRYVPDRGEAEYAAAQTAIRRIAREGRKYGLGLMLVSQRPADVESTVISQCGTWLVLRLTNATDQQHVARFLPDALSSMTRSLSSLGQQEALFVGEGAALPARVRIDDLPEEKLPKSQSVGFAKGWSETRPSKDAITKLHAEWMDRRIQARQLRATMRPDLPHSAERSPAMPLVPTRRRLLQTATLGFAINALIRPKSAPAPPTEPSALAPRRLFFRDPDRSAVRLSPDGRTIAGLEPRDGVLNIMAAPVEEPTRSRQLTHTKDRSVARYFIWAWTNKHIVFFDSAGGENYRAYSADLDTGAILPLTPADGARPTCSSCRAASPTKYCSPSTPTTENCSTLSGSTSPPAKANRTSGTPASRASSPATTSPPSSAAASWKRTV